MTDIVERLRFDAARCEAAFSKGVATNIEEAAAEIERLRAALQELDDRYGKNSYFGIGRSIIQRALLSSH